MSLELKVFKTIENNANVMKHMEIIINSNNFIMQMAIFKSELALFKGLNIILLKTTLPNICNFFQRINLNLKT